MKLTGSSSVFPTSIDSFTQVEDGTSALHLYRPATFNKLGDALYNLETHCFDCLQTNTTRWFLTFTASAVINEATESIDLSYWFSNDESFELAKSRLIEALYNGDGQLAALKGHALNPYPKVFLSVWGIDNDGANVMCEGFFRYQNITNNAYNENLSYVDYEPSFEVGILPSPHTINALGGVNALTNGSFETTGGWTLSGAVAITSTTKAYHGLRTLKWSGASGSAVSTNATVAPGESYILRFATGCTSAIGVNENAFDNPPTGVVSLTWGVSSFNGSTYTQVLTGSLSNLDENDLGIDKPFERKWHKHSYFSDYFQYPHYHIYKTQPFIIPGTAARISFSATNAAGVLLDDVRLLSLSSGATETTGYEPVRAMLPAGVYEMKLALGFETPILSIGDYT